MFRVFRSDRYSEKLNKLDALEQDIVSKFEQKLKINPYSGKPLGYKFFREKKFDGKRFLFLVYEKHKAIFLVTITDKKAQQNVIDLIKANLDVYKENLKKLLDEI
jgi:mRNA-degrading endonuclease RelE of RelBE toxin-antitoxin system